MEQPMARQVRGPSAFVIVVVTVLVVAALVSALFWWARTGPNLSAHSILGPELQATAEDVTQQMCTAEQLMCDQAYRTPYGTFMSFDNRGEAERLAVVLGDEGRVYRNVVLDLRGTDLTFEQKRYAIDVLYSTHDWG